MSRWAASVLAIVVAIIPVGLVRAAPDDVNALQARFDRENNSVRKPNCWKSWATHNLK